MQLEALEVSNYKSLRQVRMEFGELACLVGPNNSGKSNLVDAFAFLRDVARNSFGQAIANRDPARLRYYGAGASDPTMFEIFASGEENDSPDVRGYQYHYLLRLNPDCEYIEVEHFERTKDGTTERLLTVSTHENSWRVEISDSGRTVQSSRGIDRSSSPLLDAYRDAIPGCREFRRFLASFQFYRLVPDRLKRAGAASRVERLARDGSNFSSYVHTIQASHRSVFDRIENELQKNFPDIEVLATHLTEDGRAEVAIRERWFSHLAYGSQLSDGLVGFLAHLIALYGPDSPSLVIFEEPENYIHPRLMERLVDMLKGATKNQRIILSTHSVPLINRLDLENLFIVERGSDGATTVRRIEAQDELRDALKDWALGEAYASGVLDEE